jgi:tetratricopeptide (TPR) repeat protein
MTPAVLEALRQASARLQAGQFQAAHDQLESIIAKHPGYGEALRLLAGARLGLGDSQGAEGLLRRALELDPNWPPTPTTLGELLLGAGRGTEAVPFLERAALGPPPYARAALVLARYYNDTHRHAEALRVATPLCASGRTDPELGAQHIAALAALGRQDEAVAVYRRIATALPRDPAAAHALAIALAAASQHGEAVAIARALLDSGFRNAPLYRLLGRSLNAQGATEQAESALQECVRLEPRDASAHNELAQLVWLRTGELARTTAALDAALANFPGDAALLAAKAAILQGAGDARGAFACLAPIAASVQAPPALLLRAGLAAIDFDPRAALELAERAVRAQPGSAPARSLLVAAQLGVGDARAALENCEPLLAGSPDDQYLIALQATAWRLLGDERYGKLCDYGNLVVPMQLETPAGWPDLAAFLADLKASLLRLHHPNGHPLLFQSLRGGTETTVDLSRSTDPVIRALFQSFAAPIDRYLAHIGRGADPLRRRNTGRWRFNGSWSVRLHSAGFHTIHTHPRGWISSACYIELPDGMSEATSPDGTLTFGQPGITTMPPLGPEHVVRPAVGMLALFPSYFWHGTVPFHSNQARLTVAFDVVPDSGRRGTG